MNNNNNIESEFEAKCLYWNDDYIGKKNPYVQTIAEGVNDFIQDIKLADEGCECLSHTKIARRRRIRSQSGYYMAVLPNGKIVGTRNKSSIFSKFKNLHFCYLPYLKFNRYSEYFLKFEKMNYF